MGATALLRMDEEHQIKCDGNVLDVPIEWIESLPERFFDYLVRTYSMGARRKEQLDQSFQKIKLSIENGKVKNTDSYKFHGDIINNTLKEGLDRVAKYFPDYQDEATKLILEGKDALKQIDLPTLEKVIHRAIEILNEPEIDQKLTINVVKGTILSSSGGQVSFLNVAKNTLSFKEQIAVFRKDFIDPLVLELKLQQCIENNDADTAWKLIQESDIGIAEQWKKKNKKAKSIDFSYFEKLPPCSGIEGQWGTLAYQEMMFMPLASTSFNDFYNGQMTSAPLISTLARLLLFISPLGCTSYRKTIGREEHFVFSFLHVEGDCEETRKRNDAFARAFRRDNLFSTALISSHEKMIKKEKERETVTLLIEWVTFNKSKKTLLEYRVVNEKFIKTLLSGSTHFDINKIFPYAFREQLIHEALRNNDTKTLIFEEMRRLITDNSKNYYSIKMALNLRELILKEGQTVEQKTLTDRMYGRGQALQKKLFKPQTVQESEEYTSPNEKKIATIAYRLLNAAKGGNREVFFETVLRLHLLANLPINKEFTSLLDRKVVSDHEFATMSLAFIAGLMSQFESKEQKEVEEVEA